MNDLIDELKENLEKKSKDYVEKMNAASQKIRDFENVLREKFVPEGIVYNINENESLRWGPGEYSRTNRIYYSGWNSEGAYFERAAIECKIGLRMQIADKYLPGFMQKIIEVAFCPPET